MKKKEKIDQFLFRKIKKTFFFILTETNADQGQERARACGARSSCRSRGTGRAGGTGRAYFCFRCSYFFSRGIVKVEQVLFFVCFRRRKKSERSRKTSIILLEETKRNN